jgi:penicillin-binding protein 1C
LIYGLAFELGLAHPESLIEDRPMGFSGYAPVNFDGRYRGTVTIREALTLSLNVPAVMALDMVGPARLVARLKRAGTKPALPDAAQPGLAIGLGGIGLTLEDLVTLYAGLANGGQARPLVIRRTGAGDPLLLNVTARAILDRKSAWYVADILAGKAPRINGGAGRIAFKTGTSYGYRDAWALGFDGKYVIGVWVGRPDGAAVPGLTGAKTAAPLLVEAFERLGPERMALSSPPPGALRRATGALPLPLRRFRHPRANAAVSDAKPEIAFPRSGVRVDLGLTGKRPVTPLAIPRSSGSPMAS